MDRPVKAHRALLHPLWLSALALLIVNDHLLKGSGLLPEPITGKLSDLAGMIVAPALLAAILRLSSTRALLAAHAATGAVFAAIKLSPAAAHAMERLVSLTPFTWRIYVDPTDLIALPVLLVAWRVLVPAMRELVDERPVLHRVATVAGGMACMATSQVHPCDEDPTQCGDPEPGIAFEQASLAVGNTTSETRLVRVRPLKDTVAADCETLLADPTRALSRELFGPAEAWLVEPGRALPLQNDGCDAYLVDADGLPLQLLAWSEADFPTQMISTDTRQPTPDRMITLRLDEVSGRLEFATHPAVHDAPPIEEPAPPAACAPLPDTIGVDWSEPPVSAAEITAIDSSPDGCHRFDIIDELGPGAFYVCIPAAAQPFQVGEVIEAQAFPLSSFDYPESTGGGGEGLSIRSAASTVIVVRGDMIARHAHANPDQALTDPTIEAGVAGGCLGAHNECGSLIFPLEIGLLGDHVDGVTTLRPGQSAALLDGYGTLHLVRAEELPIRDLECPPVDSAARHFESVLVIPAVAAP